MSGGGGGNEGDVLLLGALRHSGMCPIPDDIQTIGQVAAKPELLVGLLPCLSVGPGVGDETCSFVAHTAVLLLQVEITARSLWLISDGKVKLPAVLPPGIAARHRICTLMAGQVKEMGYLGACRPHYPHTHRDGQEGVNASWSVCGVGGCCQGSAGTTSCCTRMSRS